jgi:ubiquinone/menaquinone biosynthesis C-methylase UbiE
MGSTQALLMELSTIGLYRCPYDHSPLTLERADVLDGNVSSGELVSESGRRYMIAQGVPNLIYPDELSEIEAHTKAEYDRVAERIYDAAMEWQFAALYEDEATNRELMVDMLAIKPDHRVLEVGCGTGRDSFRLARRLDRKGNLFLQDLSAGMVHTCIGKMKTYDKEFRFQCRLHYSISNATYLPFPDSFFDAVFHFGGFNQFGELKGAALEFARVTKHGGRILFGDEAVGPWLRGSEFQQIVCTNNPLFSAEIPLSSLPECARDVEVRWIMGNCFYVIAFTKGDGPPPLNLDLPHQGWRGGTMRTRYFGRLEGVTPEVKELVRLAAAKEGYSVHDWLDRSLRADAERVLHSANDAKTS